MEAPKVVTIEQLQKQLADAQAQLEASQKSNAPTAEELRAGQVEAIRVTLDREPTPGEVLARLILLEWEVHRASRGSCGTPAPAPAETAPATAAAANPS